LPPQPPRLPTIPPFDEIALALSGGGYRAAAFHLGTLDMLQRLGLLQSVRVLSTVSGGTLTGLKYALSITEGDTFEDFYGDFYNFLSTTNVIGKGLAGLKPAPDSPFAGQMPSLIRSGRAGLCLAKHVRRQNLWSRSARSNFASS
jgi:hypothetical protein